MDELIGVIRRADDDLIFYCQCLDATHFVWFTFTDWSHPDDTTSYELEVMPNCDYTRGFWGRLWIGLKYIFNPKS